MNARPKVTFAPEMQRRAEQKAAALGISFAEYLQRLVANDLSEPASEPRPEPKADISIIFDLVDDGPPTNIARDKDKMIGEAVWNNYLRKMGRKPRSSVKAKAERR